MRAITGAVVSSKPSTLKEAYSFLQDFYKTHESYLKPSDCGTYLVTLIPAIRKQHQFLRRCGPAEQQQGAHGYEGLVEGEMEQQGGEKDWKTEAPAGGPHGSIEEAKVAVADGEKKSKKRKKEEEPHEGKAVAGVGFHIPPSPEILSEQSEKKVKELVSVVKQEPDLVVEEDGGSERKKTKKKKEKHSHKESVSIVKQEPGLVMEEEMGSEKKGKKKKEKRHVKLEEAVVEMKGQIVNIGVTDQGIADGEKKRKKKEKKKHSEEEGDLKGVEEEKMPTNSDLNSEKKNEKKRGRARRA